MRTIISTLLVTISVLSSLRAVGQGTTFQMSYGGPSEDMLKSVCATNDAGCIMAGVSNNFPAGGGYEMYLIKTDYAGSIQWARTYGAGGYDEATSVAQTSDGGYVIAGTTIAGNKIFVVRTNWLGDTIWTRTYGGNSQDDARCIRETSDGGFIVIGSTRSFGDGINYDAYLMKIDVLGNVQWATSFGRLGNDYGISGQQTDDGGYMLVGTDSLGGGYGGILLVKTDSVGSLEWTKTYGGIGDDFGYGGIQTSDGGYLITGETSSFGAAWDALIIKTDSAGVIEWTRNYGGTSHDKGISVAELSNGNFIWAGTREYAAIPTNAQVFLVAIDQNGDSLWTKTYGTTEYEDLQSMSLMSNNQILLGTYSTGTILPDFYLIKTDSVGTSGCNENSGFGTYATPATAVTLQTTTVSSGSGTVSNIIMQGSGGTALSMCLTLQVDIEPKDDISIYPNPASEILTIMVLGNYSGQVKVEISSMLGEVFSSAMVAHNGKIEMDVNDLACGVYFVTVVVEDKQYTQRFIRQ